MNLQLNASRDNLYFYVVVFVFQHVLSSQQFCLSLFQVHQFEKDLEKLRTRQKTEMEQKLKQMSADEKRLLKHIKDKHDNDMKLFLSDQKAAYKAAKNQFKKVGTPALTFTYGVTVSDVEISSPNTR